MTDRELMQQALDTLEDSHQNINPQRRYADELTRQIGDAITALRERLVQPEQEPVAWMYVNKDGECEQIEYGPVFDDPGVTPLYTTPPQRKPLTEEEIGLLTTDPRFAHIETPTLAEFARAVIAKATGEKA